ncbi:MAG: flagellar filament capping protein FliD [Acidobacteriia bacterium]|nr:flagellar filament capping protein FliD [Terriglobia bacterium]
MGLTPLTFTGVSQFSNDFQTILTRAVAIAQLPITALQNKQSDILQEKQLTTGLESVVADLATSVTNLGNVAATQGLAGSSSDTTKVVINSTTTATPVTYAISNISSLAKTASESTQNGYADTTTATVASSGSVQLMVGGKAVGSAITMDAAHNNLTALRDAINAIPNSGVTATILTTGTGATPDYLSISATATGQNAIQLMDGATNLLTSANPGANADFYVNGAHVTSATNNIQAVVPGMTFTLVGETATDQTVTLSASSNSSTLATALQDFATKYNAVVSQLNAQIGPAAGMLSGNHLIYSIQNALRGLVNYAGTGSGAITSLAALGISLDSSGTMTFNQTSTDLQKPAFNSLSSSQIAAAFSFLSSGKNNFGALVSTLTQYSDPLTGAIKAQQNQYDATDKELTNQIKALTDHANQMQTTLTAKLQAADAQLAAMQSQQQMLTSTVQALNFASYGYSSTNNSMFSPSSSSGG